MLVRSEASGLLRPIILARLGSTAYPAPHMSAPAHPIGSFCFAELHTPEPELSARFYCSLLNWNLRKISDDYWMFELNGSDVVGMRA